MFIEKKYSSDPNYKIKANSISFLFLYEYLKAFFIISFRYLKYKISRSSRFNSLQSSNYLINGMRIYRNNNHTLFKKIIQLIEKNGVDLNPPISDNPRRSITLYQKDHTEIFNLFYKYLKELEVISDAESNLKKKLKLDVLYLFIQDTSEGWHDELPELKSDARSKTRYMHIDSSPPNSMAKFIVYLNEVDKNNGPFEYVKGSHLIEQKGFIPFIRRVNDLSGASGLKFERRKFFSSLPKFLQYKGHFGSDIDNSYWPYNVSTFTGSSGDMILFDNSGIHRGGLINKGRRISIHGGFK